MNDERLGQPGGRGPQVPQRVEPPARPPIMPSTTLGEAAVLMAEGNIGAMAVLGRIAEELRSRYPVVLLTLDDMNMRGTQVYVGFKDVCRGDIQKYIDAVMDRKDEFIRAVNTVMRMEEGPSAPVAVKGGGSKRE